MIFGLGMRVMNVAIILPTRADGGFYVHEGGWEYNAVLAAIGLLFLAFGSGRAGLDHLFIRPSGGDGELIQEDPRYVRDAA